MADGWSFLSTHGLVFVALAGDPDATQRQLATRVGVTERTIQKVVSDLVTSGYVVRVRVGRRNQYRVNEDSPLRHPLLDQAAQARDLVRLLQPNDPAS